MYPLHGKNTIIVINADHVYLLIKHFQAQQSGGRNELIKLTIICKLLATHMNKYLAEAAHATFSK